MRSHFMLGRGVALACAATGAAVMPAGVSSAQVASDSPVDPAYDNGWQEGDNGGFGFGPWNMDGTYTTAVQHSFDDGLQNGTAASSQHNNLGEAWTLYNPLGPTPGPEPNDGTDISRAGRALLTPLQVGQTLSMTVDNPTQRNFFRGWTVKLNTGGANMAYAGDNPSTPAFDPGSISARLRVGTFEYFSYGRWFADGPTTLFDTDTNDGVQIDVTLTGVDTYSLTMTSPGNTPFTKTGTLAGPLGSSIDWVEFEYYGTDSDTYPVLQAPRGETDFYISSMMQIVPEPCALPLLTTAAGLTLARRRPRAALDRRA